MRGPGRFAASLTAFIAENAFAVFFAFANRSSLSARGLMPTYTRVFFSGMPGPAFVRLVCFRRLSSRRPFTHRHELRSLVLARSGNKTSLRPGSVRKRQVTMPLGLKARVNDFPCLEDLFSFRHASGGRPFTGWHLRWSRKLALPRRVFLVTASHHRGDSRGASLTSAPAQAPIEVRIWP